MRSAVFTLLGVAGPHGGDILLAVIALLGSAGIGGVIVKALNKPVDAATAEKLHAETRQAAQATAASEVTTIREVMGELRAAERDKGEEIAQLKADMVTMKDRVDKLEERERHMLTRAAVHEAWDQMAFSLLVAMNPHHPPPPPIVPQGLLEEAQAHMPPEHGHEE